MRRVIFELVVICVYVRREGTSCYNHYDNSHLFLMQPGHWVNAFTLSLMSAYRVVSIQFLSVDCILISMLYLMLFIKFKRLFIHSIILFVLLILVLFKNKLLFASTG